MTTLQTAIRTASLAWLVALAILVAVGLLRGTIKSSGLVSERSGAARRRLSPTRIQLLLATLVVAAVYVGRMVSASGRTLPGISAGWLALFGVSNAIHLAVQAVRTWRQRTPEV
jgi:hypothetical protein